MFAGWPAEALEFYDGLLADNSKTYWLEHKPTYDADVLAPMQQLLSELAAEFGGGKIFRPYRDVRFSKDKTPYKTAIGATLERGGYIQLSSNGLGCGSGMYHLEPDQLKRFRAAVADDVSGVRLSKLLSQLEKAGVEVASQDTLKTVPRGFEKDHPRAELLRHKGLIGWKQWPVEPWLGTKAAKPQIVKFLRTMQPLNDWLAEHV